ncbi:hypothetical protein [Roseibium denhamense]|uniref:Uncharacterized protein n=1 Tax=Roseibium denhamense TaxID=76305 RepID=A0ABY1NR67_9HYPH|nr:hypothetical protein [Roseibium denhamense]SMP15887.1 hypothetical protein SAMN06265374_1631 [Roseibium denhamense]
MPETTAGLYHYPFLCVIIGTDEHLQMVAGLPLQMRARSVPYPLMGGGSI